FKVVVEGVSTREDRVAMAEFQEKLARLQKATTAAEQTATEARRRLGRDHSRLRGDAVMRARNEATPESISERVTSAASSLRQTTGRPTRTVMENYQIASDELAVEIPRLRRPVETDIRALEKQLDAAGAPPTPGRLPDWKK